MTEEGRRLLAAATERPWRWPVGGAIVGAGEEDVAFGEITDVDADLIVAAVNQYAALLDLWEAVAAAVAEYDREGVIDAAHELYVVIEDLRAALSQEEP